MRGSRAPRGAGELRWRASVYAVRGGGWRLFFYGSTCARLQLVVRFFAGAGSWAVYMAEGVGLYR